MTAPPGVLSEVSGQKRPDWQPFLFSNTVEQGVNGLGISVDLYPLCGTEIIFVSRIHRRLAQHNHSALSLEGLDLLVLPRLRVQIEGLQKVHYVCHARSLGSLLCP